MLRQTLEKEKQSLVNEKIFLFKNRKNQVYWYESCGPSFFTANFVENIN